MDLSASIEAAWGLRERPHRGPKPGPSLPRIVEAGVKIAAAEGLAGVSMSRVGAEAGAAPMSLYRHVSSKDERVALMVDAVYGEFLVPIAPDEGWREGLTSSAWVMHAAMYRHPWVPQVPISGLPVRPNEVAWFEQALGCMRDTGLTEAETASVIMLVSGYVQRACLAETVVALDGTGPAPAGRSQRPANRVAPLPFDQAEMDEGRCFGGAVTGAVGGQAGQRRVLRIRGVQVAASSQA
jgi:AcrR family transcriptional regulator